MDTPSVASHDPIPMPSPSRLRPVSERIGKSLGRCARRARTESNRLIELLRASRTHEGRQRNLAPLIVLAASGAFLLGLGLGLRRR